MKILSFLISDKASVDNNTNKLTIEGVFDSVYASAFPAKHNELMISLITEEEPGEYRYKIFVKKDGKEIGKVDETISVGKRHYFIAKFPNFIFPEPGVYTVEANIDDKTITTDLHLLLKKQ